MPQQEAASSTSTEPKENSRLDASVTVSMTLERTISAIAPQRRLLILSLKISMAIKEVATISKLLSRDAFSAVVRARPSIKKIGAKTSSTIMPSVYGRSR